MRSSIDLNNLTSRVNFPATTISNPQDGDVKAKARVAFSDHTNNAFHFGSSVRAVAVVTC